MKRYHRKSGLKDKNDRTSRKNRGVFLLALTLLLASPCSSAADESLPWGIFIPAIIKHHKIDKPASSVTILPTYTLQRDYFGDLLIVGEVYNNTSTPIRFTQVTANVFNGEDFVAADWTYVIREIVMPKTKSCFKMHSGYGGNYTKVRFESVSFDKTVERIQDFSLSGVTLSIDDFGGFVLTGLAENTTGTSTSFTSVIGTFYNQDGQVIDCDYTYLDNHTLSPQQSSSFEMLTSTPASLVFSYKLQTDYNGSFLSSP